MLRNYFKTAFRSLARNRNYTFINIAGLTIGIAVCIVIFAIIQFQTSFDNFHSNKDRIYRVITEHHQADAGTVTFEKNVPFPMPKTITSTLPQVQQVAPVYASHNDQFQVLDENGAGEKMFKEQNGVFYTSPSFFKIFDYPLLAGTYESLKDRDNVLITKETAETYFGDWKSAVGKRIRLTGSYRVGPALFQFPPIVLKVSGVLATVPPNTDFQLKLVIAWGTDFTGDAQYGFMNLDWNGTSADYGCFLLLPPNVPASGINQQLNNFARNLQSPDKKDNYVLQPISDVHYDTEAGNYSNSTIARQLINVLWLVAAFILLIACVNFINLATAQAVNRAKEIGVRKILGGNKSQLQVQFIIETLLIVTIAVLLATVITIVTLPAVSKLLQIPLAFNVTGNPVVLLFLLALTIVVTLLAGFYPAVVLSRFNPVNALKSKIVANTGKGISLRRGLVVFQFMIAQVLIIGTLIVVKQMNYFMSQPLGFDKDAIVSVPFRPDSTGGRLTSYLRQQLYTVKGVQAVSFSSNTPMEDENDLWTSFKFDHAIKEAGFQSMVKFADTGYLPAYKLQLVAGRNLQGSDMTKEFLVNESMAKSLGFKNPEDILNKEISIWDDRIRCNVVGVLKDFNDRTLRHNLAPLIVTTNVTMYRQAGIKLATTDIAATMQDIKKVWQQTFPASVYEYRFLDEKIASFYRQENQLAQLYKIFAAIAIFLSCLGLYGLASFMAVQRIKEIGIRKVLGATAGSIVYLFSKEFILLICIAFAIASPIAWYVMHHWLQDYAYRVDINWWLFAIGGFAAIVIALATISFQAVRAAAANPVKSLRTE